MKSINLHRRTVLGVLFSFAAFPLAAQERPVVATDNYPLAYFAQRLGGGAVDPLFLAPSDADPSFWRPGIADIAAIQSADIIALNGAGFSTWPTKASLPRSRTIDTSAGFSDSLIQTDTVTHSHGEGGQHSHEATASYTWLDFGLAQEQATALAGAMIRAIPDQEGTITQQSAALIEDLAALDARAAAVSDLPGAGPMIASHPRYQYFGAAYGLQIAAVEWDAKEEPTDAEWAALETLIADTGSQFFVWEAAPSPASQERMAALGLTGIVFPPLANTPDEGDFLEVMNASLANIERAFE